MAFPGGPPPAPVLSAIPGYNQVQFNWTEPGDPRYTHFTLYASTQSGGPYTPIATGITYPSYTDTNVLPGVMMYYVVTATNPAGTSPYSNQVSATPLANPPPTPTNLTASAGDTQVTLNWTAPPGTGLSYTILRSTNATSGFAVVGSGIVPTTFLDTGLTDGTTYYYYVEAAGPTGLSGYSNEASATPVAMAPPPRVTSVAVGYTASVNAGSLLNPIGYADYAYDANGRVESVRTPKADVFYTYNSLGQITQIVNATPDGTPDAAAPANEWFSDPYPGQNSSGRLLHTVLCSFTGISYDLLGSRTGMQVAAVTQPGTSQNGNPTQYGSGSVSFQYDNDGRLLAENWSPSSTSSETHQYDLDGNLTQLRGSTLTNDAGSDRLTSSNVPGYGTPAYDLTGEMTGFRGITAGYDPLGQTASVSGSINGLPFADSMTYDDSGRRAVVSTQVGSTTDTLYYDYDGGEVVSRLPAPGAVLDAVTQPDINSNYHGVGYLWGPTGVIMEFSATGDSRTFLFDPSGNCVCSSNGVNYAPNFSESTQYPVFYDGFGLPVWTPNSLSAQPPALNRASMQPFQFKGQLGCFTDAASGLVYCLHRYYDPAAGRWTSRDPSGLDGGANSYAYCEGDPIWYIDPDGRQAIGSPPSMWQLIGQYLGITNNAEENSRQFGSSLDHAAMNMPSPGGPWGFFLDFYKLNRHIDRDDGALSVLGSVFDLALDSVPDGEAFEEGIEGGRVAQYVLQARHDGFFPVVNRGVRNSHLFVW